MYESRIQDLFVNHLEISLNIVGNVLDQRLQSRLSHRETRLAKEHQQYIWNYLLQQCFVLLNDFLDDMKKNVYFQYIQLGTHIHLINEKYGIYPTLEALPRSKKRTKRISRNIGAGESDEQESKGNLKFEKREVTESRNEQTKSASPF